MKTELKRVVTIFMAGVAREDITPAVGTLLFGYNPFTESNSIHDPLQVTTIAFQQGETTSLLISVTLGGIQNELAGEIRSKLCAKTGVPAEHIIIATTHTHSGPNTVGMEGWGEIDRYYVDTVLIPMILKTGHNAIQTLQPAELAVGVVRSEVGINRRKQYRDGRVDLGHNP